MFLAFSSTSILKWWWRFHAAILLSCGAPRSTRAAPAGPTPSRGSSVLSTTTLSHTHNPRGITHSLALKRRRRGHISEARRTCRMHFRTYSMHSRVNTTDTAPSGDSPLTPAALRTAGGQFACAREPQPTDTQTLVPSHVCAAATAPSHTRTQTSRTRCTTNDDHCFITQQIPTRRERHERRDLPSTVHWLLLGLTDKIITNVHEMLDVLCTWVASHNRQNIMKSLQRITANV